MTTHPPRQNARSPPRVGVGGYYDPPNMAYWRSGVDPNFVERRLEGHPSSLVDIEIDHDRRVDVEHRCSFVIELHREPVRFSS